jgi:hypothetical protein
MLVASAVIKQECGFGHCLDQVSDTQNSQEFWGWAVDWEFVSWDAEE